MDFVSDALFTGEKLKILTIVDTYTKESPATGVRFSYKGADVVTTLRKATQTHGFPKVIRLDNGPEFISKELDLWAYHHKVTLDFQGLASLPIIILLKALIAALGKSAWNENWF